jgi:hypothetical protein
VADSLNRCQLCLQLGLGADSKLENAAHLDKTSFLNANCRMPVHLQGKGNCHSGFGGRNVTSQKHNEQRDDEGDADLIKTGYNFFDSFLC